MTKIFLIGCGYHAKRIYIPFITGNNYAKLVAILDLKTQQDKVEAFLRERSVSGVDVRYTSETEPSDYLTRTEENQLDEIAKLNMVDAVIISTEPLSHLKYARWALEHGLHILMDKPITTEIDVSTSPRKSRKLYEDFMALKKLYLKKLKVGNVFFSLLAQRRYHPGFIKTRDLIAEMSRKTNCPTTSIQAFHSDGQWRFPWEIIEQDYHPYNQGYGKLSHSGYHSLDAAVWFSTASILSIEKKYNGFEVYTQGVRPFDFLHQITPADYRALFPDIADKFLISGNDFSELLKKREAKSVTGEIDAHALVALKHGKATITNIGIHAIHNGFSQRNWVSAEGRDLYKGNGRVRHESYTIEQGPFQCIIVNSYQSHEIMKSDIDPYEVGGEYHYDIHVFRNSTLLPEYKPYEFISMKDLMAVEDMGYSRGHQEKARQDCIQEFLESIGTGILAQSQSSNFLAHELPTQILSALYESMAKAKKVIGSIND
ncbi:MAG: Gfo/Idh/MocA family oxidoreductase [bacterium]|nr:Gfo/Idh/MocA family oxidoreductase [bacterium]